MRRQIIGFKSMLTMGSGFLYRPKAARGSTGRTQTQRVSFQPQAFAFFSSLVFFSFFLFFSARLDAFGEAVSLRSSRIIRLVQLCRKAGKPGHLRAVKIWLWVKIQNRTPSERDPIPTKID